jgi:glycosyltransferase involved in cell wall biosynthesis
VRIALVARRYWPAVGGIERVAAELAQALRALGHEVGIVAQRVDEGPGGWLTHTLREAPEFAAFDHEGLPVQQFRLPLRRRLLLLPLGVEAIPLLPRLTNGQTRRVTAPWYGRVAAGALMPLLANADVVHVLGGAWISVAAVEAARALKLPVVVTPFTHRGYWRDDPGSVRSYRRADAVVATLESDAQDLRALGVPSDAIAVCGLPVARSTDREAAPDRPPLVLFVGARVPHKGIDVLRAAARTVWAVEPEIRFAYVGPGAPLAHRDPRELDVGVVTDSERGDWLGRATVLCLPSSSESFGLVVAEAWSARRPVVTSEIPVLRELVARSHGGISVPRDPEALGAAIVRLGSNRELAGSMGDAGFDFWRRECRPEAVAERHLQLYAALVSAASSNRSGTGPTTG